eukprot:1407586-Prymnesium_polylepis.1
MAEAEALVVAHAVPPTCEAAERERRAADRAVRRCDRGDGGRVREVEGGRRVADAVVQHRDGHGADGGARGDARERGGVGGMPHHRDGLARRGAQAHSRRRRRVRALQVERHVEAGVAVRGRDGAECRRGRVLEEGDGARGEERRAEAAVVQLCGREAERPSGQVGRLLWRGSHRDVDDTRSGACGRAADLTVIVAEHAAGRRADLDERAGGGGVEPLAADADDEAPLGRALPY